MDKQKQIEEMARIICKNGANDGDCDKCGFHKKCYKFKDAGSLYNAGYRKINEGAVVLTREDMSKYAKDCIAGQETGLDIINALIARAERYKEQAKKVRKETAEKFAERLKEKLKGCSPFAYFDLEDLEFDGGTIQECIDEICKELEGEK